MNVDEIDMFGAQIIINLIYQGLCRGFGSACMLLCCLPQRHFWLKADSACVYGWSFLTRESRVLDIQMAVYTYSYPFIFTFLADF